MKNGLREQIYAFVVAYIQTNAMPPTIREIGDALQIASTGHIDHHLKALEKEGRLQRLPGLARGIRLTQPSGTGIPIMGAIAAGTPLDIFPDASETMLVDQALHSANVFALVVRGTSMIDDYICDGDYVIIRPQSTCENGDIVVATHLAGGVSGSATLKRFFEEPDQIRLQPANAEMNPLLIPKNRWYQEWKIQGKVVAVFRSCPPTHR